MGKMIRVKCNQRPVGDIRIRQPKQPGQKKSLWNIVQTILGPVITTWGNICKDGNARCVVCGMKGHEEI